MVRWLKKSDCRFGAKCDCKHDPAEKNKQPDAVGQRAQGTDDQDLVVQKPVRIDRVLPEGTDDDKLVHFATLDLPAATKPRKGNHFSCTLNPQGLKGVEVQSVWDGGAEGTTISEKCASRIMRAQGRLPRDERQALVNLGRYAVPQNFYGFTGNEAVRVDAQCDLTLTAPCGTTMPTLLCRVVPGQADDLLVAAPDLDLLGW